jgi:hypothetical protein
MLPAIAIALVLSFVVHDIELTHEPPFSPHAHTHEGSHEQNNDPFVSMYTHSDRKDFLSLLLIATVPALLVVAGVVPYAHGSLQPQNHEGQSYDFHRLFFRRGILNSKRY